MPAGFAYFLELAGLVGVCFVLFAYLMVQMEKWEARGGTYLVLNFFGAGLIVASLLVKWNLPAFVIEAAWMAISFFGLVQLWRKRES